jgi:ribosome-associated heat shock protein Hsp15
MADGATPDSMPGAPAAGLRIDKWLWYARFCKSRSLASQLCRDGRVRVNRAIVDKPKQLIRPDDVLTFAQGPHVRIIRVVALGVRRGPASEARLLYEDLAPPGSAPPPPLEAVTGLREPGSGRPTKRERRDTDRLRGEDMQG